MTRDLALAAVLFAAFAASPSAAQPTGRGHLVSLSTAAMLCAGESGFHTRHCRVADSRLRFHFLRQVDDRVDLEIQVAASGLCLGTVGAPVPGARVQATACGTTTWRYDTDSLRLTYGGLCLEADAAGDRLTALAACAAEPNRSRRQEWSFADER